jgi:hypothetical protein
MGRIDDVGELRRFDVRLVSVPAGERVLQRSRGGRCRRAARSCAVYCGRGLVLLGQQFSAGAWAARSDAEVSLGRGR